MKTRNSTKSKLLSSVIALVLCVSMLIGATFAWFTDTASTGVNKIQAGNLKVEVDYKNPNGDWAPIEGATSLFSSNLWEPGHTEYVYLRVKNAGTLGLKYKVMVTPVTENGGINVAGNNFKLSDYLVFGTTQPEATCPNFTRETARAAAGATTGLKQNDLVKYGLIEANREGYDYLALVVYMPETVGNDANAKPGTVAPSINLGVTVVATQLEAENDSFNNTYDADADENAPEYVVGPTYNYFPQVMASASVAATGDTVITASGKLNASDATPTTLAKVTVPAAAVAAGAEKLTVTVVPKEPEAATTNGTALVTEINDPNRETANFDVKVDGIANSNTARINVEIFVGKGLVNVKVYHNGALINGTGYDPTTGIVSFTTTSFSDFTVAYDAAVAAIGTKTYGSLANAVAAAKTNDTITLLKDSETTSTVVVDKNLTINMNGYNITGKDVRAIQVKQGTLKLDGTGTVSSTVKDVGSSVIRVGDNAATKSASLYVYEGVTVSTKTAYGITAFGNKSESVHVYGTVTSTARKNDNYDGCAISTLGDDTTGATIKIYDGATVSATNTNSIYMPSGTLYVKGGTITGRTGIYVKSGSTTIEGGTITGTGLAKDYDYYKNGGISTGDALVVDSCGYPNGKPSVTVSGGTFTSANAKAVASYNTKGNALVTGFVRGGTFSSKPVEDYLFDGRIVATNTNGTFTVEVDEVDAVAQIGEVYYGTLYEAVSACTAGDTIKLLRDVTLDKAYVTYDGWANCATGRLKGTLDGNNHTITLGEDIFFGSYFGTIFGNPCLKNVNIVANNGTVYVQAYRGTFENVKVSGSIEVGNNTGAFVIYGSPYSGALTFKNCEMAATMYGGGTANNYNAAFVGYGMGSGAKFNFEDCKMTGSLTCGVAAVFLGNDSQLGGNWKVNISNFTFGENAAVRNTLTSGYSWKFNGIVAANNAPGTPVVTIGDTTYSGADGFTQLVDAKNTIWDAKHFAYGPLDASLKLTKNEDGTFTITPAESKGAVKYVVSMAVYTTATAGGSLVQSVSETITNLPQSGNITTTLKDLKFIDKTWLTNNTSAEKGTLAGNTIYTLDGVSYYMIGDNVHGTLNGNPKSAQIYGVTAYDANGNIVASAPLTK